MPCANVSPALFHGNESRVSDPAALGSGGMQPWCRIAEKLKLTALAASPTFRVMAEHSVCPFRAFVSECSDKVGSWPAVTCSRRNGWSGLINVLTWRAKWSRALRKWFEEIWVREFRRWIMQIINILRQEIPNTSVHRTSASSQQTWPEIYVWKSKVRNII